MFHSASFFSNFLTDTDTLQNEQTTIFELVNINEDTSIKHPSDLQKCCFYALFANENLYFDLMLSFLEWPNIDISSLYGIVDISFPFLKSEFHH